MKTSSALPERQTLSYQVVLRHHAHHAQPTLSSLNETMKHSSAVAKGSYDTTHTTTCIPVFRSPACSIHCFNLFRLIYSEFHQACGDIKGERRMRDFEEKSLCFHPQWKQRRAQSPRNGEPVQWFEQEGTLNPKPTASGDRSLGNAFQ